MFTEQNSSYLIIGDSNYQPYIDYTNYEEIIGLIFTNNILGAAVSIDCINHNLSFVKNFIFVNMISDCLFNIMRGVCCDNLPNIWSIYDNEMHDACDLERLTKIVTGTDFKKLIF